MAKFQKGESGNPAGKPLGTLHKATRAAQALLDGEAETLTRLCVDKALAGDMTALKLCMDRILPQRRLAPLDLPNAKERPEFIAQLLAAVSDGTLEPGQAETINRLATEYSRASRTRDLGFDWLA